MKNFGVKIYNVHDRKDKFELLPESIQTMEDAIKHVSVWDPNTTRPLDESQIAYINGLNMSQLKVTVFELADSRIINVDDLRAERKVRENDRRQKRLDERDRKELETLVKRHRSLAAKLVAENPEE